MGFTDLSEVKVLQPTTINRREGLTCMGTLSGKAIIRSMMCVFSSKSPNYLDLSCETDIDSFIVLEGKKTPLIATYIYI